MERNNRYNKYMNGVDRSDQVLGTNNVMRKCLRWWKTMFFHLIDIAVVNGFILFKEHQANHPDDEALRRSQDYTISHFRAEIIRQICNFPKYGLSPVYEHTMPTCPPCSNFGTVHMPVY